MIKNEYYFTHPDGREIRKITIENKKGEYVEVLDYGASINGIYVKNKDGALQNVAYGVEKPEELLSFNRLGMTVGRVANRIRNGRFVIDGVEHQVEVGANGVSLHSESGNYAKRIFTVTEEGENNACFYLKDEGMAGYTVPVDAYVRISFDDESVLTFDYEFIPYGTTLLCPTNHAYFNLNGFGNVNEDELQIRASRIAVKEEGMPGGKTMDVADTIFDFRESKRIDAPGLAYPEALAANNNGYDDIFLLDGEGFRVVSRMYSPKTGIAMTTATDMPAIVCFIPNFKFPGAPGYPTSVCLECQFVPNAVNCPEFEGYIYREGEKFVSRTTYTFTAE